MLPILVPTRGHRDHGEVDTNLGVKRLVLICGSKDLFESAHIAYRLATDEDVGTPRYGSILSQKEAREQGWRPDESAGWAAEVGNDILSGDWLGARPPSPRVWVTT